MDLNHIHLPPSLIESLYKNHLVGSSEEQPTVKSQPAMAGTKKNIQYLGKNLKKICLLVDYANDVYLPDNQLHFLTSILQACKLNLGDVAIVNVHQQKISFAGLREEIPCNYLLNFGVQAGPIGLPEIAPFTITNIQGCQLVYAPASEELNNSQPESKSLKSQLWLCLKQLFAV